ncbi:MAG: hypothetical protein L0H53_04685 [Candidatus Nitrosocosmicus sp.]|nr:hypothetical protein [Candidatus Nitrosocosmicus sp.]MDN5867544.1 hypothetical protein [Candidatus Nitrosocosmicus sp.]
MISECYHIHHNSIKSKSGSDTELIFSTIMSILIGQSNEIEILNLLSKNGPLTSKMMIKDRKSPKALRPWGF